MVSSTQKRVLLHVLFWIIYLSSQALIWMNFYESEEIIKLPGSAEPIIIKKGAFASFWKAFLNEIMEMPGKLFAVYTTFYFLLPRFLFKKRPLSFSLGLLSTLALAGILQALIIYFIIFPIFFPGLNAAKSVINFQKYLQYSAITSSVVMFTGAIKVVSHYLTEKSKYDLIEKQQVSAELKYLKDQLNPHFLFNTLNNLYGLSLEKSDKTPGLLLKLSGIMSYVLYEANTSNINLSKELSVINDYLEIEKIRCGERLFVSFHTSGNKDQIRIPPLILLPFVENACKHSTTDELEISRINIFLEISDEKLIFTVENSKPEITHFSKESETHGVGLINAQRRMNLLFPEKYSLDILDEEKSYLVKLTLQI